MPKSQVHRCRDTTAICNISVKTQNKNLGKISIGWRKSLRVRMYRKTCEETIYYSITKFSNQSVIAIANNFEVLCI